MTRGGTRPVNWWAIIAVAATVGLLILGAARVFGAGETIKDVQLANTVFVHDGDTFRATFRILNIDAPEIDGKCQAERDLAIKSRNEMADLLQSGLEHGMWIQVYGVDRYGRILAKVQTVGESSDGTFTIGDDVGRALIDRGLAHEWKGSREQSGSWCP